MANKYKDIDRLPALPNILSANEVKLTPAQANEYSVPVTQLRGYSPVGNMQQAVVPQQPQITPLKAYNLLQLIGMPEGFKSPQYQNDPDVLNRLQQVQQYLSNYNPNFDQLKREQDAQLSDKYFAQAVGAKYIDKKTNSELKRQELADLMDVYNKQKGLEEAVNTEQQRKALSEALGIDIPNQEYFFKNVVNPILSSQANMNNAILNNEARADLQKAIKDRQIALEEYKSNTPDAEIDRDYKRALTQQALNNANKPQGNKTAKMPAGTVTNLAGTQQSVKQMNDLILKIEDLPERLTTPGVAELSGFNPWDTQAQAFQQYINTTKQVIGKGLEGGVLRKEDEEKYQKIIPKMGDTKEVLRQKARQLQYMLIDKYNMDIDAMGRAGYDISGFHGIPKVGNGKPTNSNTNIKSFKTEYEAEQANLPSGTVILINGRKARVK